MFCMQIKDADAIMRIPLHFLRSAIKVSESRSPPWHVQSKSKPKTFDSILKFMSSTVKVTPRNERYRKVTNIWQKLLLTIAHDCSRFLTISHILWSLYCCYICRKRSFWGPGALLFRSTLLYAHDCSRLLTIAHDCSRLLTVAHDCSRLLTIAHDLCARVDCSHLPANLLFDQVSARARVSSSANRRQDLELPY